MKSATKMVLVLCLILSKAFSLANNLVRMENMKKEGISSEIVIHKTTSEGTNKSNAIQASVNGHSVAVVFLENIGEVTIRITTASGSDVDFAEIHTPDGINFYIPSTGSFIIYFCLDNGDQYYGEFEIND